MNLNRRGFFGVVLATPLASIELYRKPSILGVLDLFNRKIQEARDNMAILLSRDLYMNSLFCDERYDTRGLQQVLDVPVDLTWDKREWKAAYYDISVKIISGRVKA